MPYIKEYDRERLDPDMRPVNAGELNFSITKLCAGYIEIHGLSYSTINEAIGVLECAKLELYRRIAAPYEDLKKRDNGDVYPEELLTKPTTDFHDRMEDDSE